jgi:hypothetical protein
MFVPKNFTVAPNTNIIFKDCTLRVYNPQNPPTVNIFKNHFEGEVVLENLIIYIEDTPIEFVDKIEYYTGKQEEMLLA